jgi:hypothetical protein
VKKLIEIMNKINENFEFVIDFNKLGNFYNFIIKFPDNKQNIEFKSLPSEIFRFKEDYNKNFYYRDLLILNDFIVFILLLNERDFSFYNYYDLPQNTLNLISYKKTRDDLYNNIGTFKTSIFKNLINNFLEI